MAKDIRSSDIQDHRTDKLTSALITECRRQEQSCLYTSTTLYIWLRCARWIRKFFVVAPIILGALATWSILDQPDEGFLNWLTAVFALLAGLFPAVFEALKLDTNIDELVRQAAQFKNLQDRFRQAASVASLGPYEEFKAAFDSLIDRMDAARSASATPPEWCFKAARKKIKAGHYEFDCDINSQSA